MYIIHKLMVCCSANDDCCHVPGEFYEGNYTEGCILLRSYYCDGSRGNATGSQIPHGAHNVPKVLKPPASPSVERRGFHWTLEPSQIRPCLIIQNKSTKVYSTKVIVLSVFDKYNCTGCILQR